MGLFFSKDSSSHFALEAQDEDTIRKNGPGLLSWISSDQHEYISAGQCMGTRKREREGDIPVIYGPDKRHTKLTSALRDRIREEARNGMSKYMSMFVCKCACVCDLQSPTHPLRFCEFVSGFVNL